MIKALAALLMLLDHVGAFLADDLHILRVLGRLSMPLFAYGIARGFHVSFRQYAVPKYLRNLLIFALLSQVPYQVLRTSCGYGFQFNIGVTWILAVFLLTLCVQWKHSVRWLLAVGILFVAEMLPVEYGMYGVLYPALFYFTLFRRKPLGVAAVGVIGLELIYASLHGLGIQWVAIFALPILLICRPIDGSIRLTKAFYYWLYPIHLAILFLLRQLLAVI